MKIAIIKSRVLTLVLTSMLAKFLTIFAPAVLGYFILGRYMQHEPERNIWLLFSFVVQALVWAIPAWLVYSLQDDKKSGYIFGAFVLFGQVSGLIFYFLYLSIFERDRFQPKENE